MPAADKQFICKLSNNGVVNITAVIAKFFWSCSGFSGSLQELKKVMIILQADVERILIRVTPVWTFSAVASV
jgi:hypothetical protein